MRLSILLFLLLLLPVSNVFAISSITKPTIQKLSETTVIKKQSFKEKLLLKWYKKQLRKQANPVPAKKKLKMLIYISFALFLMAPVIGILGAFVFGENAVLLMTLALIMLLTAAVLGLIYLSKRKKLADKTGIKKWPAFIVIILNTLTAAIAFLSLLFIIEFY